MGIVSGGGGGGNTTAQVVASGKVLPVADATGVTVDTTTYDDPAGAGKLTTLVFPATQGALAIALTGDVYPRWLMTADGRDGLYIGDGTFEPYGSAPSISAGSFGAGDPAIAISKVLVSSASRGSSPPRLSQVSPAFTITSGAIPNFQLVSGTGHINPTANDVEMHTPVTFNPGVATIATCTVAISPDNVTYTTLAVVTKPVGTVFDGEIDDLTVRLPANWYLQMTVVNATLGVTTYY